MNLHCFLLLTVLLLSTVPPTCLGNDVAHTFTTPDGRSLKARIIQYNERGGKIQIEREDGKKIWSLPTVFIEEDQNYIRQWIVADRFMAPMKFRIDGKADEGQSISIFEQQIKRGEKTEIVYEIILDNRTDTALRNLKIEYRGFFFDEGFGNRKDSNRVDGGELHVDEIPAGAKISLKAAPLTAVSRYEMITEGIPGNSTTYGKKTNAERLEGFWIKIYGPEINGKPSIREWSHPSDFRKSASWKDVIRSAPPISSLRAAADRPSDKTANQLSQAIDLRKTDPAKSLSIFQEIYRSSESLDAAAGIGELYLYYLDPRDITLGLEWLDRAAADSHYRAIYLLMQFFDSKGDAQYRDLNKAIEYAEQLLAINPSWGQHAVLAKLYARNDQFDLAVKHQKKALDIVKNAKKNKPTGSEARLKETLTLYKNKQVTKP